MALKPCVDKGDNLDDLELTTDPAEEKDRNFITALARGLDVLRAFKRGEIELTNTDISERTGLPKATVSRLTYTLVKLDYLVANARTGTYRLGPGVMRLGFGVLCGMEIGDRARMAMAELCKGPNDYITVALGERYRAGVVYLAVERSVQDVSLSAHVGMRLPLFYSAIGKAVLVGLSEDQRDQIIQTLAPDYPGREPEWRDNIARGMEEYEAKGFCTGFGEWRPDVNGIAVPVFSPDGGRVYGMNVGGPSFHVQPAELEAVYAPKLIAASESLGQRA